MICVEVKNFLFYNLKDLTISLGLFLFYYLFIKNFYYNIYDKRIIMAGKGVFINIGFPFKESNRGFFLKLNNDSRSAIKSDLMHLILTRKGERLYMPDFGTNLLKYIFEPNDDITNKNIKKEISDTVKKYLPNLAINDVIVTQNEKTEYGVTIRIDYTVTEDVFQDNDFVIIEL